jgi:hypothetical protein
MPIADVAERHSRMTGRSRDPGRIDAGKGDQVGSDNHEPAPIGDGGRRGRHDQRHSEPELLLGCLEPRFLTNPSAELTSGRGFDEPHQLVAAVTVLASELD